MMTTGAGSGSGGGGDGSVSGNTKLRQKLTMIFSPVVIAESSSGRGLFGLCRRLVRIFGRLSGDRLPSLNGRFGGGNLDGGEGMG
jgi:hypothetical protein